MKTLNQKDLPTLYSLWDQLGSIPVDSADTVCIEQPFLHFKAGTQVEAIWRWFESQNENFVVGEVMQGIRQQSLL